STIPDGLAKEDGRRVGQLAAVAALALDAIKGINNVVLYACSSNPPQPGEFEPDGGCNTQPAGVQVGRIQPLTLKSSQQFRPDGPDPLTSNAYAEDFIETRDYGRSNSAVRTLEQTDVAYFWQAVNIHQGLIDLAVRRGLDIQQSARFFAMVYT